MMTERTIMPTTLMARIERERRQQGSDNVPLAPALKRLTSRRGAGRSAGYREFLRLGF